MRKEIEDTCVELLELLRKKNADYGDSFHVCWEEYGPVHALIRMEDKLNRMKTLLLTDAAPQVKGESVRDTLLDLAGYAVLSAAELNRKGDADRVAGESQNHQPKWKKCDLSGVKYWDIPPFLYTENGKIHLFSLGRIGGDNEAD